MITFGDKIKELRLKKGLTQAQVADAIGVTTQAYAHWEKNRRQPDYDALADLLYLLGNPTFQIKDRKVIIGGVEVNPSRKYVEIPSYDEVLKQYLEICEMTGDLTTIQAIQKFAKANPQVKIKINGKSCSKVPLHHAIQNIEYTYKNLTINATINEGGSVGYGLQMSLTDDQKKGKCITFTDGFLILPDFYQTFEKSLDVLHAQGGMYTLNPHYDPNYDSELLPKELKEITNQIIEQQKTREIINEIEDIIADFQVEDGVKDIEAVKEVLGKIDHLADQIEGEHEVKELMDGVKELLR